VRCVDRRTYRTEAAHLLSYLGSTYSRTFKLRGKRGPRVQALRIPYSHGVRFLERASRLLAKGLFGDT